MEVDLAAPLSFGIAAFASAAATPLAIGTARRIGFYDRPREYRKHETPTPFLGGAAVLAGFLTAAAAVEGQRQSMPVLLGCAVALWAVGTLDDHVSVPPRWRVLAATCAAVVLVSAQLGWRTSAGSAIDLALSVIWVVGVVNAFNLMDNLDGACSTVAAISAAGIGCLGVLSGDVAVAILAFALAGACGGFLPWNLAGPAKIFLGDGGSMMIGFLVAALAMSVGRNLKLDDGEILAGALLVGVPIVDTTLVIASRRRRRVSLLTGGRDHLTHRILLALGSPRWVAIGLAGAQTALCAAAIGGVEAGSVAMWTVASTALVLGVLVVLVLDRERWRPPGIAIGPARVTGQVGRPTSVGVRSG